MIAQTAQQNLGSALAAAWVQQTADGFQIEDISKILEKSAKIISKKLLEAVPGGTAQQKTDWAKNTLKMAFNALTESVRAQFTTGLFEWAGYAAKSAIDALAASAIDWLVDHTLTQLIQWAYADNVIDGTVTSASFTLAAA